MVNRITKKHIVVVSVRIALEDGPEEVNAPVEVSHERVRAVN